jgi:hypothetical protein
MFNFSAPTVANFILSEESGEIVSYSGVPPSQVPNILNVKGKGSDSAARH